MKIRVKRIFIFTMWVVILSFFSLFSMQQNASSFLNFFKSQSIPVEDMRFQGESVTLKLHYKDVIDSADDNMKHHVLTIVRKVAVEFKRSKNIIIEMFDTGELISELSFRALHAYAYAQGNIGDEEILSKMTVKEHVTIEDMMASLTPEEAESEKPIKIINPPALDSTKPNVAPNYAKVLEGNNQNKNMLKTARQLLNKKDYDKAIGQFRKTIDSLPFQSFQGLGLCYYYKKYFDDAFYYFAKAYKENPRSPLTLFYMAATLDQWGKGLEAIFCFESYLKLNDPDKNRREIAQQRWQYLKRRSQRPGHALYRSVDEVIYVILGEEINGGTPVLLCLNGCR